MYLAQYSTQGTVEGWKRKSHLPQPPCPLQRANDEMGAHKRAFCFCKGPAMTYNFQIILMNFVLLLASNHSARGPASVHA